MLTVPKRQGVAVVIGIVEKAAFLDHQAAGVRAAAAGVPAQRALPGGVFEHLDGLAHVIPLDGFIHVLVVDPAISVAADLMPVPVQGDDRIGVALHRHADGEHRRRNLVLPKQAGQPPDADPAAVFVDRLHVHMPHPGALVRADDFGEERLGGPIAVQYAVFAALFVVEHDLQGQPGAARPPGIGGFRSVTGEISGVMPGHRVVAAHIPRTHTLRHSSALE